MPRYSHDNIVVILVVTNVIILEFLSVGFVHPGALLSFYLLFNTRIMQVKTRITKASKLLMNFSFRL